MTKQYFCLIVCCFASFCAASDFSASDFAFQDLLPDSLQMHGFLTQGIFHSSDNNMYGKSDDGLSPGLTEIGLNLSYRPMDRLTVAAQGLYRRAGDVDPGSFRLDYGLVDLSILDIDDLRVGLRGGRVKIPYGLYNETRDVSFTHPGVLLAQGIYFDRSRSLFVSMDGGALYFDHTDEWGDLSYKLVFGMPQTDKEIMIAVLGPFSQGELDGKPGFATQLNYEMMGGRYVFAVSYVDLELQYDPVKDDSIGAGYLSFRPLVFSAQFNGEKFGLTGEYLYQWNRFSGFGRSFPDKESVTQSWYVESTYRFIPQLQGAIRHNVLYLDNNDKQGDRVERLGVPDHVIYAKDWMVSLRWDVTYYWMLRAEYHRIEGTAWIPSADNPDPNSTQKYWDLYGLQLSYRF
ncbi:MAG: hypothetical protein Q7U30_09605 [Methylicorpusculum sp.]|nr:hypothetical protein [Methylicorpusculum sp.]